MGICASGQDSGPSRKSSKASQNWVWSKNLKGDRVKITEKGKTASQTGNHEWDTVMVDKPLTSGKYTWKIKLTQDPDCLIGVCSKECPLQGQPVDQDFWGFYTSTGSKWIKGQTSDWKTKCKEGDEIEVTLEFIEDKGVLGFSKNNKDLGVIAQDIPSSVYPAVFLFDGNKVSLIN